jgi:hypothetical protein
MATKKTTKKTTTTKAAKKAASKKAPPTKATTKAKAHGAKPAAAKTSDAPEKKAAPQPETAKAAPAKEPKPTKPAREQVRDPRLPEPGTVIQKRDRQGNVRCECTVEAEGVHYNGTVYRSLSAAAMAAAKDLSLGGKTQNGFTFWGLSKPPRKGVDPIAAIEKAWQRYRDRLHATISNGVSDENRERVHALVQQHSEVLVELREGAR